MATFDTVTVTAAPAVTTVAPGEFSETFPGVDGAPWPAAWEVLAAGGAAVSGATQQASRGRMALPNLGGRPAISARRSVGLADVEVYAEVHGAVDTASAASAMHFREVHVRVPAGGNPAGRLTDAYYVTIYPSTSAPATEPWNVRLARRKSGVDTTLAPLFRGVATGVRSMRIRFRVVGLRLRVRVWDASTSEPSAWHIDITDTATAGIASAGGVALLGIGGDAATVAKTVEWDAVSATPAAAPPVISLASASPTTIWDDPIYLNVSGSDYTTVQWEVLSAPPGAVGPRGTFARSDSSSTTFVPDTAGDYRFRVTLSNFASSTSQEFDTAVYAQMWQRTETGKVPVRLDANGVTVGVGGLTDESGASLLTEDGLVLADD